jgi:hypothetical protein
MSGERSQVVTWALVLAATACAGRTIPHDSALEHLPHITWEMSAGQVNSMSKVCRSRDSETRCVLRPNVDEQLTATVTLELHGAAEPVTYAGNVRTNFLSTRLDHPVKETVEPGNNFKTVAILDDVVPTPGNYAMDVELMAHMGETNHPIRVSIPVVVEAASPSPPKEPDPAPATSDARR